MNRQKLLFLFLTILLPFLSCKKDVFNPDEIKTNCVNGISPARKVLLIGVDGCRTDALLLAHSPAFDSLMAHAYVNLHTDRGPYTVSAPGWSTILHGVYPSKHHVYSNDLTNLDYRAYKDIFYYMRQFNPNFSLATVCNWRDFMRLTTNETYSVQEASDEAVKNKAIYLLQNCVPDVLLLHFDAVDAAGHSSGFSPENPSYINAIQQTGNHVTVLMETIKFREKTLGEKWMVIVVTDHGGQGTSHGDQDCIDETRYVFQIVRLPSINRHNIEVASNVDIMPTILKYMNVPIWNFWYLDGSPLF